MIIDGKSIAETIQHEIRNAVSALHGRKPCLSVILVGNHPPSQIYVNRKTEACKKVGILSKRFQLPETTPEKELLELLQQLNDDAAIDGILLQLPLPAHLNPIAIIRHISPKKDVDGLHPENAGKLLVGDVNGFVPCTPLGVKMLLERTGIETCGKHVVIMGRSNLVGKPLAALLLQNTEGANATVTVVHSLSENIPQITQMADILVTAMGQPEFIKPHMIKEGAVVIDVGISKVQTTDGYKIVGDVDFDAVKSKCSFITPVPGGVGPMTIAMLLHNTLKSYRNA